MTSIEDRLRDLGARVTIPVMPSAGAVMRRGRRRRLRRRSIGLAAVAVVGSTGGIALQALRPDGGDSGGDSVEMTGPGPTGRTTTDVPDTGSAGPGTRVVPDVVGLTVAEARPEIERLGLSVSAPSGSDAGQIVGQEPAPDVPLHVGRPVSLEVADLDRPARVDGPVIRGTLLDGRTWTVGYSTVHGLCVTLGPTDLGCDDVGPAIPPGADPATPRTAADATGSSLLTSDLGALVTAFLPPGAETVELIHDDGRTVTDGLVVEPTQRFWAMPIQLGDNPDTVVYRDASGREISRFPTGG